ncbi:MAG: PKD domain-containing protein, partial [Chitinophagaceae bacterium]|nr:PKD domain-containing protein [Chitinophagaceae bacterium]
MKFILLSVSILIGFSSLSQDFSNKGKDFWVGYGYHERMNVANPVGGSQDMVLYFATEAITNITVSIPGTGYTQTFPNIPANTIFETPPLPKSGTQDARLLTEGQFNKGIHIVSDKPVVAYAHIYNASVSGATLLFPTVTLGKEYYSVNYKNVSNFNNANCWFYVCAADTGTTTVEITPSAATLTHAATLPFTINLQQGEIYNVMGVLTSTSNPFTGVDLTGSKIKSISTGPNGCKRIAVFSGSGRISLTCNNNSSSSDNYMVQSLPQTAWGQKYLTVSTGGNQSNNFYRICVSNPSAVVKLNGAILNSALLINKFYYEIGPTTVPNLIEADKPIMVAQYLTSQGACGNGSPGDPEIIYLSPVEQNINKVILNSTSRFLILQHYINVIIPNTGTAVSSFKLDGATPSSSFIVHPQNPGFSYLQQPVLQGQHTIQSDSGFNAIAYGYGNAESYGYNAGTNVKDLYQYITIKNQYATVNFPATCRNSPFQFSITLPYRATSLTWDFNNNPNLIPNAVVVNNNPVPDDSSIVNGKQLYLYKLPANYSFNTVGLYPVKVTANNPTPDGCSGTQEINYDVSVFDPPIVDWNATHSGCVSDAVNFFDATNGNGRPVYKWNWDFGDNTIDSVKNPIKKYLLAGTYNVKLQAITDVGCISDITKQITITEQPVAKFGISYPSCSGKQITFFDSSSQTPPGNLAKWIWDFGDGTNSTFTTPTNPIHPYQVGDYTITLTIESNSGCISTFSLPLTISPNPQPGFILPEVCLNDAFAQFIDTSKIATGTITTWAWNFGDPSSGTRNISNLKNPQ